jgi:hypothetical protein
MKLIKASFKILYIVICYEWSPVLKKGGGGKWILSFDSVKRENENKDVLEHQFVTTSWSQDTNLNFGGD